MAKCLIKCLSALGVLVAVLVVAEDVIHHRRSPRISGTIARARSSPSSVGANEVQAEQPRADSGRGK